MVAKEIVLDREQGDFKIYVGPILRDIGTTVEMWRDHWNEQKEEEVRGVEFKPDVAYFKYLEDQGYFKYVTVRKGEEIVGHFGLSFGRNKQTSQRVAGDDFFYIKPEYRGARLGGWMVRFARDFAFSEGAVEFSCSFRTNMPTLDGLLRRCGMHPIATVYTVRA